MSVKFTIAVLAAFAACVAAITPEEKTNIQLIMAPVLIECSAQHKVSQEEIETAQSTLNGDHLNPCFIGCFFKKFGVIDGEGMYDPGAAMSMAKQYLKGSDDLAKAEEVANKCRSVNDASVPDGKEGCERSKLLMQCITENRGDLNPF